MKSISVNVVVLIPKLAALPPQALKNEKFPIIAHLIIFLIIPPKRVVHSLYKYIYILSLNR